MKIKIKHLLLPCCGFVFQYIIPIILFGNVIPFTHGVVKAGLTAGGYIALGILVFIIINKAKEYFNNLPADLKEVFDNNRPSRTILPSKMLKEKLKKQNLPQTHLYLWSFDTPCDKAHLLCSFHSMHCN